MFPVPTLIAVPVMPVPVVVIGGAPDGGNTQQQVQPIQPVGPVGPLGPLGPWNPAGMTGDAAWGPWNYGSGNWADGQNDWTSGHAAPEAWGQGQNAWQNGGNGGDAAKDLLDVAYDYQVDSVRALVQLLQDVLADKSAEKEYGQGKNPPCHRYALPDEGAKMLLRWLNDTAAKACWAMEPFAVEDRFKPVPSGRLTKTMERLVAQITSACEAKERCVMRAQLLSSLTKALICLVDSTVYTIKTPAKTIEALIPMLERYRPKYVRAVREFQRLQMLSLQKIAEAIDILVQRKPRATRATAKRDGEQIRGNVDWIARTLMSLKGCSWSRNPSMAYKEFLQRLNVSQESISRVMNHAQFYVWNKMQYFWTEAAKEKTRLQWIRYQKAMQAALQGSSVSSTETEDASAGDWFHAEEPAEAMNGEEGHSEWLEPSFASEDVSAKAATYDWAETDAKKDRSDSNAAEAFRWCNQPVEGMTEHGNGQMESQTNEAFCWWNQPMEGMTEHRNGQMESQTNEAPAWCTVPMTEEVLSGGLMKGNETVGAEAIEGKHIGLYFSAHWCGPCRQFTPELAKWYAAVKKEMGDKFEIVFCSGDRDAESLKGYYEEQKSKGGDWLALPFEKKDDLDGLYKVSGIPTFLIVDPDGNVVCKGGRALVNQHLSMPAIPFSDFPWAPSALQELDDPGEQDINDKPTMCLMLESVPIANQSEIMEKVKPIAEKWAKTGEIQFLVARQNNSASATIRAVCGLETVEKVSKTDRSEVSSARGAPKVVRSMSVDTPWLIILDCPEGGAYYLGKMAKEMDGSGMEAMLEGWKNKTLERKQLK